jgi:putative methionine-R-sulfoxide reductase with GAF domain
LTNCTKITGGRENLLAIGGVPTDVKPIDSAAQDKPVLDRESFQQLLEAAYVLQEQNDRLQASGKRPDFTQAMSELVEIQHLIQSHPRELSSSSSLIAARAQKFTGASGAAVGVVKDDELIYKSAIGIAAEDSGMPVPIAASLSAHCLASGQTLQSPDALGDRRIPSDLCRENGVRSLIAVPALHDGKVAGVLELRFSEKNGFQEQDVRTCQLMAGLLADAIARAAELEWKQALAAERATMIEALAKIKPQLERMAVEPARPEPPKKVEPEEQPRVSTTPLEEKEAVHLQCRSCGHELESEEFYCGICGTPRPSGDGGGGDLQSKWASLWHLKQAADIRKGEALEEDLTEEVTAAAPLVPRAIEIDDGDEANAEMLQEGPSTSSKLTQPGMRILPAAADSSAEIPTQPPSGSTWTSASSAKQWLDTIGTPNKTWFARNRANVYLATAAILLFAVIAGWGSYPSPSTAGGARSRRNQAPPLSFSEKILVELGLAVPPPALVPLASKGNPNVRVWEDERTALYYCPGSDLYGKTERGKFSSQRDAQIDQFEPAFRRACE